MSMSPALSGKRCAAPHHVKGLSLRSSVRQVGARRACFASRAEAETTTSRPQASTEETAPTPAESTKESPTESPSGDWVSVLAPEELPKGVRKEVSIDGTAVLLFWYRNQIYAIAARSPAEGAYSEGFIKAKFTQDYGIICPQTGSVFSLKDGSVAEWYPSNPVLRSITPIPDPLPIYPVKLTQDAIMVDVGSVATSLAATTGGADTSLEKNNVFAVQPKVYTQGSESDEAGTDTTISTAATLTAAITGFAIIATAGTATALYFEDYLLLGGFWALMFAGGAYFFLQFNEGRKSSA